MIGEDRQEGNVGPLHCQEVVLELLLDVCSSATVETWQATHVNTCHQVSFSKANLMN